MLEMDHGIKVFHFGTVQTLGINKPLEVNTFTMQFCVTPPGIRENGRGRRNSIDRARIGGDRNKSSNNQQEKPSVHINYCAVVESDDNRDGKKTSSKVRLCIRTRISSTVAYNSRSISFCGSRLVVGLIKTVHASLQTVDFRQKINVHQQR